MSPSDAIERYLFTGEHDPAFPAWAGRTSSRRRQGSQALRRVLTRVVEHRARRAPLRSLEAPDGVEDIVCERITGLLHGLLPAAEASHLAKVLPERVQTVSVRSLATHLDSVSLDTGWRLANLLLDDLGAPPLSDDAPTLDGVCAHGRAWVTGRAFAPPVAYSDILVHEVAHLLHDLSRGQVGLSPVDRAVIPVPPYARETFAYAAEVWSCVSGLAANLTERRERVAEYLTEHMPVDFRVDTARLGEALIAAVEDPICGWRHVRATVSAPPAGAPLAAAP